jgi:hypothetical protein
MREHRAIAMCAAQSRRVKIYPEGSGQFSAMVNNRSIFASVFDVISRFRIIAAHFADSAIFSFKGALSPPH